MDIIAFKNCVETKADGVDAGFASNDWKPASVFENFFIVICILSLEKFWKI